MDICGTTTITLEANLTFECIPDGNNDFKYLRMFQNVADVTGMRTCGFVQCEQ